MGDNKEVDNQKVVDNKEVDNQDEKQSNKTFTQSEFDSMMAKKEAELKSKYGDYDDIKNKYAEIEKWKSEKEMEEMSEVEKLKKQVENFESKAAQAEQEKTKLALQVLKNDVLSDKKYSTLTRAYKLMIKGTTEEEIRLSADDALDEYTADLRLQGVKVDVPPPSIKKDGGLPDTTPKTVTEKAAAKFKEKNAERMRQLGVDPNVAMDSL